MPLELEVTLRVEPASPSFETTTVSGAAVRPTDDVMVAEPLGASLIVGAITL